MKDKNKALDDYKEVIYHSWTYRKLTTEDPMNYWFIKKNQQVKFKESDDGLSYVGSHGIYELLKGISSNGLNSDIVFLIKRVMDDNNVEIVSKTKILDFLYGGFSSDNIEYFERLIEKHEIECDDIEKREKPLF